VLITYGELPNSTFLDYDSYRSGGAPPSGGTPFAVVASDCAPTSWPEPA
jgi:hypothetical protein